METRITIILVDKRLCIIIYDIWFIYDNIIWTTVKVSFPKTIYYELKNVFIVPVRYLNHTKNEQ